MNKKIDIARKSLFDPLAWYLSKNELTQLMSRATNIEDIVDSTEKYIGRGHYARIHAVQHRGEILELAHLVQKLKPKTVVELGTDKGGTFFIWCRLFNQLEHIASIDLPNGSFGGGYNSKRIKLYNHFLFDKLNVSTLFLRSNSHHELTRNQLLEWLKMKQIDFLYIDGDHTYQGVKQDFEMYANLVRPGGIIAFHDILTKGSGHEVYKYWIELKKQFPYKEIIQNPAGSMGIGVIEMPND